jgi:hypothetical protein
MFLRAMIILFFLVVTASPLAAAPMDYSAGRQVARMEVGSRPPAQGIIKAVGATPRIWALLVLAEAIDDEPGRTTSPIAILDGQDGLPNVRWYHVLGLPEQMKPEQTSIIAESPLLGSMRRPPSLLRPDR